MRKERRKKVLITGGAGFVGINLSRAFADKGWDVIIYDDFSALSSRLNKDVVDSLTSSGNVRLLADDVLRIKEHRIKPHVIIHLASRLNQKEALENPHCVFTVNTLGTQQVLEFSRRQGGIPVIFASTCKVYSTWINTFATREKEKRYAWKDKPGISERDLSDVGFFPRGIYGASKLAAEIICQEYFTLWDIPIIINRMSSLYGWHQHGSEGYGWLWHFIKSKEENRPVTIYGSGKQVRDVLFIDDLCALYIKQAGKLAEGGKKEFGIYTIGGGARYTLSLLETADILNRFGGTPLRLSFQEKRPADFNIYISDVTKAKKEFDWEPLIAPKEGIRLLVSPPRLTRLRR